MCKSALFGSCMSDVCSNSLLRSPIVSVVCSASWHCSGILTVCSKLCIRSSIVPRTRNRWTVVGLQQHMKCWHWRLVNIDYHRRRSSVNFRGARHFCPKNMHEKLTKCPNFMWFLPKKLVNYLIFKIFFKFLFSRKINNCGILQDFCPKNARILHKNCSKNIFSRILGGTCSPAPVSYAYVDYWQYKTRHCY